MQVILVLVLVLLISILALTAWRLYRQTRFGKLKEALGMYRLLVIIRKSQPGINRFLQLSDAERALLVTKLNERWKSLLRGFAKLAPYCSGVKSTQSLLPIETGENWSVMRIYSLAAYQDYRACVELLEDPHYRELRNYFEIHLVFGERLLAEGDELKSLF
ncbi:MAG TPA: hypothetical protein PKN04_11780 [bacterium]|jgi:hypothetical protein|nr:hypothetical protein [bacterium]HNT66451.1 hypothetical protein [bacterium]HOX85612.1 hypothetical protein [bacterium]HPG44771.1 hypothetical protein [bacterium]HPM99057.1 hypothetical protein [bacterium]